MPFDAPVPVANKNSADVRVIVHPQMRGKAGSWEEIENSQMLVRSMAKSIAALHNLPAEAIEFTGLPVYSASEVQARLQRLLEEGVAAATLPPNLFERWESALGDESLFRFECVPVHGDLGPDSFLCSGGTVSSVSAFASAHLGDPAEDLAWILSASAQTQEEFLTTYRDSRKGESDLHILTRASLWAELALLRWLLHGKRTEDEAVIGDAKQMLNDLADEVGDDALVPGHAQDLAEDTPFDLRVVDEVLPTTPQVDPNAPTVNLSAILNREDED